MTDRRHGVLHSEPNEWRFPIPRIKALVIVRIDAPNPEPEDIEDALETALLEHHSIDADDYPMGSSK